MHKPKYDDGMCCVKDGISKSVLCPTVTHQK